MMDTLIRPLVHCALQQGDLIAMGTPVHSI